MNELYSYDINLNETPLNERKNNGVLAASQSDTNEAKYTQDYTCGRAFGTFDCPENRYKAILYDTVSETDDSINIGRIKDHCTTRKASSVHPKKQRRTPFK